MVAIVSRAILVRVLPESLIEFRYFPSDAEDGSNWLSRVQNGWKEERSLLAWADRGRWHTVETSDEEQWREGNWFRIGCEPLFVDFTKSGTWFVIFSLFKVSTRDLSAISSHTPAVNNITRDFPYYFWILGSCRYRARKYKFYYFRATVLSYAFPTPNVQYKLIKERRNSMRGSPR